MLKGYYSNMEIAKIVYACNEIEELMRVAESLILLHEDYEILDIRFFETMSNKRIVKIVKSKK